MPDTDDEAQTIHKAYKTQLRTTPEQRGAFRRWAGCARYIYNWALNQRIEAYEEREESLSAYAQDKAVTQLKKDEDHEWLSEPPRRVLYYAIQDLDQAFQNFFRRVKNGETPGFPRFKSKGRCTPSCSVYGTGIKVERSRIRLPKLGWVRLEEKGYIPTDAEKYGRVTVSRDVDKWYISVATEVAAPSTNGQSGTLYVHPGVREWISMSNEESLDLPTDRLDFYEARMRRQQRKLSRKEKGSNNRAKMKTKLAKTHRRIRNIRKDATHKATAYICYALHPERLVVQDWDIRSMLTQQMDDVPRAVRRRIRRHIANANMSEMLRQLEYKSEWANIDHVQLSQDIPVSKRCSECMSVNDDFGAEETFVCPSCGVVIDREKNALQNMIVAFEDALEA